MIAAVIGHGFPVRPRDEKGWDAPVLPHPILKASYPTEWLRVWPHELYHKYYALNDGLVGTVSDTLLTAIDEYDDPRHRAALANSSAFNYNVEILSDYIAASSKK